MTEEAAPDPRVAAFAAELEACLESDEAAPALAAFRSRMGGVSTLPKVEKSWTVEPHPLVGFACALVAGALVETSRSDEVYPFLVEVSDRFAPPDRYYALGGNLADLLGHFGYLRVPLIRSSIVLRDQDDAVALVNHFAGDLARRPLPDAGPSFQDPFVQALARHPGAEPFGPFGYDPAWLLERQREILGFLDIDHEEERVREFETRFAENALRTGQPERALRLIEGRLPSGDEVSAGANPDNLEFYGICALASLGRFDEALHAARGVVRRGYRLRWRFDLESAAKMPWTQVSRQNDHLAALARTDAYQAFLNDRVRGHAARHDTLTTAGGPLSAVRDDVWGGGKPRKCALSRRKILPGEPVVRFRLLHAPPSDGGYDVASAEAFQEEPFRSARQQFETDRVPVAQLFPHREPYGLNWGAAALDAFAFDVAQNPAGLDIGRAVDIVAAHHPRPIRFAWRKNGEGDRRLAFEPLIGDEGHGKAVNLVWRLIKAGFRDEFLAHARALPNGLGDKVFAMLATFEDDKLRAASADHFGLPDLPAMMDLVFREPLTLDEHLTLADFGRENARYRAALALAMKAYALQIYSNSYPGADWFLQGLEHYRLAHCSHLIYLLIHHPEDVDVFAQMLANSWSPEGVGSGGHDAYDNAAPFYYRAALFNRAFHAPEQLDFWLADPWMLSIRNRSQDRQARRLAETLRRRLRRKPRDGEKP